MFRRVGAVLLVSWLMALPVNTVSASHSPQQAVALTGFSSDAAAYASIFGVSADEARQRLSLQPAIGRLDAVLTVQEPATFGGLYITNGPDYGVVALFTRDGDATLRQHLVGTGLEAISRSAQAEFTMHQLLTDIRSVNDAANAIGLSTSINVYTNRVEIYADSSQAADLKSMVRLPGSVVVIQDRHVSGPTADIYGGLGISGCTSGFSVKNASGTKGVVTAGHCGNTQSYLGTNLPFQGETFGGSHDEQWHTTPGFTPRNWIVDPVNGTRPITGRLYAPSQAIGSLVCKYGVATGYGCGTLVSKTYRPSWVPNANPTFHKVQANGPDLSNPGDSGGPVFVNNTAYGIISGQDGLPWCICDLIYTPVDYVESIPLGISLITS